MLPVFNIVIDTREKKPWNFKGHKTINKKLNSGDYSLVDFEDVFSIERKLSVGEIANNIIQPRFEKELIRLDSYKLTFMICEFTWDDVVMFPIGSNIPKSVWHKIRIKSEYIQSSLMRYQVEHNIKIIFAGKNGDLAALEIFKHVMRLRENGKI